MLCCGSVYWSHYGIISLKLYMDLEEEYTYSIPMKDDTRNNAD